MGPLQEMRAESAPSGMRSGWGVTTGYFSSRTPDAAQHGTGAASGGLLYFAWGCFRVFVQAVPYTAEGTLCRVQATRSLVPRAYQANRSNPNTSRARQRDRGYAVLA